MEGSLRNLAEIMRGNDSEKSENDGTNNQNTSRASGNTASAESYKLNAQLQLEREVLGVFFKNPSRSLAITMRDFGPVLALYTSQCRELVRVIFGLLDQSEGELDLASIIDAAEEVGALKPIGGQSGIDEIINTTFTSPEEFPIVVQRLKNYHTVRKTRSLLETSLSLLSQGKRDPQQILNLLKWDIDQISENTGFDRPRALGEVIDDLHQKTLKGKITGFKSFPSGFEALDRMINGIGQGELILIGGAQGVGKTIMAFQMARNLTFNNASKVLYVCFEHSEEYLFKRLIPMESVNPQGLQAFEQGLVEKDVIEGIKKASDGKVGFVELLRTSERGKKVLEKIEKYKNDLILFKGNTFKTTLQAIRWMAINILNESPNRNLVIFVDYLQKIPVYPEPANENEKVTIVTEGLKDIALSLNIPIISVVAADKEGLKANRLRLHHLRGSSAIDYEADIALILNDKSKIISKTNVAYNPSKIAEYNNWVVCTIEKNRTGRKMVDLEFEKHFKFFCFDPRGRLVEEQLIEEKLFKE